MFRVVAIVGLCAMSGLALPVSSAAPGKDALTQELMKLSGLERQIRQIPQQILAGFQKDGKKLPPEQYAALRRLLSEAFDARGLERRVAQRMHHDLSETVMTRALEWLRSEPGRKITRLEEQASTPQALQQMRTFAKQLQTQPPSQERLQLARLIDRATGTTEMALEILETTTFSIAAAVDATLPRDQRQGQDRLRIQIDRQRPKWRETLQEFVLASFLFTYQSLNNADLERYLEFLESDAGRDYSNVAGIALKEALSISIDQVSHGLVEELKRTDRKKRA